MSLPGTGATLLQLPPLSLYIHVPWCVRKCPYCDFNSHELNAHDQSSELPETEYVDALLDDLRHDLRYVQDREIASIFIGGGTPSLFSAAAYERLLDGLQTSLRFAADIEITLEANPGTAEATKFADYFRLGINRLSLGVQSFDPLQLQKLGRIHDGDDALRAIDMAQRAGFTRLNIDIMYGLPGQNTDAAMRDLQTAVDAAPEHLSWYQLTIEPNTVFYRQPPPLPPEDALIAIQDAGLSLLAANDFHRYEISAFARRGGESRHNLNYWCFGDYLGIGAGAHSKLTEPRKRRVLRLRKRRQPAHYLQAAVHSLASKDQVRPADRYPYLADATPVEPQDLSVEFLMNALRLREGFTVSQYEARTGLPFEGLERTVSLLSQRGLLSLEGEWVTTTELGYQLLNSVLESFL